jgi:hypothetical protein
LRIDDEKVIKLKSNILGAQGDNLSIRGGLKNHVFLREDDIDQIKRASSIQFEISKCSSLKAKYPSVKGVIAGKNLQQFKKFFETCK